MKHAFRPSVSSLEDRLALTGMGAAAQATPAVPLAVATTTMNHVFLDTLGRRPDAYAVATLTPAMQAGLTVAQLTTGVVSSPEYIGKNISSSPTASSVANET